MSWSRRSVSRDVAASARSTGRSDACRASPPSAPLPDARGAREGGCDGRNSAIEGIDEGRDHRPSRSRSGRGARGSCTGRDVSRARGRRRPRTGRWRARGRVAGAARRSESAASSGSTRPSSRRNEAKSADRNRPRDLPRRGRARRSRDLVARPAARPAAPRRRHRQAAEDERLGQRGQEILRLQVVGPAQQGLLPRARQRGGEPSIGSPRSRCASSQSASALRLLSASPTPERSWSGASAGRSRGRLPPRPGR